MKQNGAEVWERPKLWEHQKEALIDAISTLEALEEHGDVLKPRPNTIGTLKAMLGIKSEFPQYMNDAISEMVDKYPEHGRE